MSELKSRKDAGAVLLTILSDNSMKQIVEGDDNPMFAFTTLQYLLADQAVLEHLSSDQRRELIGVALQRYQEIITDDEIREMIPVDASAWLIARTAALEFPEDAEHLMEIHPSLSEYISSGMLVADDSEIAVIEESISALLKEHGYGHYLR